MAFRTSVSQQPTFMKLRHHLNFTAIVATLLLPQFATAQIPNLVNYQGRVAVGAVNFEGTGQFKFALVNTNGTTTYWGNSADTAPADGVPDAAVSLSVTKGLYSVALGDTALTNMATIPASVWANADVRLRVWFNDGVNGFQLLTPDQRLAPNGYLPDGSVASAAIAANAITSAKIATGAVTNTQLASGIDAAKITTGTFPSINGANLTNLNGGSLTLGSVTLGALATNSVDSAKIVNGSIAAADIASGAVTAVKLGSDVGLWSVGGANVFRTAGSVGIGTASPQAGLSVTTAMTTNDYGSLAQGIHLASSIGGYPDNAALVLAGGNNASGTCDLAFATGQTGVWRTISYSRASNEICIPQGRFGIGNTNPKQPLDVGGNINLRGSHIIYDNTDGVLNWGPGGAMRFRRLATQGNINSYLEHMVIQADGSVGIGTSFPGARLEVSDGFLSQLQIRPGELNGVASSRDVTLEIPGNHTIGIWDNLAVSGYTSVGYVSGFINVALSVKKAASSHMAATFSNESGTAAVQIASPSAALYVNVATGTAQRTDDSPFWSVSSDRRLKTGIVPLTGALDIVTQLNPVRYHYTAEHRAKRGGQPDKEHYGIIAQEYQKLFPDFVTTGSDGYLSVQSDPLIFVATAAIKELRVQNEAALVAKDAEIAALKKELAANHARDNALEARLARLEKAATEGQPAKVALTK